MFLVVIAGGISERLWALEPLWRLEHCGVRSPLGVRAALAVRTLRCQNVLGGWGR